MSLVYEALQKAEKEKGRKTGATPLAPVPTRIEPVPVPPAAPSAPIVALAQTASSRPPAGYFAAVIACVSIVALAAIVYIVVIAARNLAQSQPLPTPPAAQTDGGAHSVTPASDSPAPVQAAVAAPAPAPAVTAPPFKLTGIMKLGDKFGAVVDGHIVYEGQYVEGAVVKSIERDHVTLTVDGHDTVIRLF